MVRYALGELCLAMLIAILGCPPAQPVNIQTTGPAILVEPSILSIPTGGSNQFTVALSADPGGPITLQVLCIAGGCGFSPVNMTLFFDSSNYSIPQAVVLTDIGFHGRGQSIFEVSGAGLTAVDVEVVRN